MATIVFGGGEKLRVRMPMPSVLMALHNALEGPGIKVGDRRLPRGWAYFDDAPSGEPGRYVNATQIAYVVNAAE